MKTLVLFDKTEERLIPINGFFFQVAQFSKEKELNEKYQGNLVLYPSGEIEEISKVEVLGYYGTGFFSKMLSLANATYNIRVELVKTEQPFDSIIEVAKAYLSNDLVSADPYMLDQADNLFEEHTISSGEALYEALRLPEFEDCLDIMV